MKKSSELFTINQTIINLKEKIISVLYDYISLLGILLDKIYIDSQSDGKQNAITLTLILSYNQDTVN